MRDLATAVALAIAIEGALYALFPAGMQRLMAQLLGQPASRLRAAGLMAAVLGVTLVWLIRS